MYSIIIPSYNDTNATHSTLRTIAKHFKGSFLYEVIIVDNNSQPTLSASTYNFSEAKIIYCSQPGSYAARNLGAENANYPVLIFLDSGVSVTSQYAQWLADYSQNYQTGNILFGGAVKQKITVPNVCGIYDRIVGMDQRRYIEHGFAVTANLIVSKDLFNKIRFDEQLMSSGDLKFGIQCSNAGHRVEYCKQALVIHAARNSISQLLTKQRRIFSGQWSLSQDPDLSFRIEIKALLRNFLSIKSGNYAKIIKYKGSLRLVVIVQLLLLDNFLQKTVLLFAIKHIVGSKRKFRT